MAVKNAVGSQASARLWARLGQRTPGPVFLPAERAPHESGANVARAAAAGDRRLTALWLFFAGTTLFWLIALALDVRGTLFTQWLLGASAWLLLALLLARATPAERLGGLSMVSVATVFECLASLVLGFYEYRLSNLPAYVPPGHGIFYLVATRLSQLVAAQRGANLIVFGVMAGSSAWVVRGLLVGPSPDLFGAVAWLFLVRFLLGGRAPVFYAVSFTLTMGLEFYGTWLGTWTWAVRDPVFGLPMGNPPSAIGAGYCVLDSLTRRVSGAVGRLLQSRRARPTALAVR